MDNTSDDSIQGAAMLPGEGADTLSVPKLRIPGKVIEAFGNDLTDRVAAYAAALEAHRFSIGEPRPVEHPLVEAIVAAGGMEAVEIAGLSVILCMGSYGWNERTHRYGNRQSVAGPAFGWARAPGAIRQERPD